MTDTITAACPCWYCREYEDARCDVCGKQITPTHDAIRVRCSTPVESADDKADFRESGFDVCKDCLGADLTAIVINLAFAAHARGASSRRAFDELQVAREAADEAFRQATSEQQAARAATVQAAVDAYRKATGNDDYRAGSYIDLNPGDDSLPF